MALYLVYVELGKYELALSYLNRVTQESFLLWHKKGLAYLGLSQQKELDESLIKMKGFLEKGGNNIQAGGHSLFSFLSPCLFFSFY